MCLQQSIKSFGINVYENILTVMQIFPCNPLGTDDRLLRLPKLSGGVISARNFDEMATANMIFWYNFLNNLMYSLHTDLLSLFH